MLAFSNDNTFATSTDKTMSNSPVGIVKSSPDEFYYLRNFSVVV